MGATAERIDTSRVRMPGQTAGSVSGAPTEMLREEITSCVDEIRRLLEPKGLELTKDERLPQGYLTRFTRGDTANLNAVEREVKRLHAVRQELADRAVDQKRKATAELKAARESLESIVAKGPAYLDQLNAHAGSVVPSLERMRQLVNDVHEVLAARKLGTEIRRAHDSIRVAASALGQDAPNLPDIPRDMPTEDDCDALVYVIRGVPKGANDRLPRSPSNMHRAADHASRLKRG